MVNNIFFLFQSIREILLVGHRQAFAWIDDWYGMTLEDVRDYESRMQAETNARMRSDASGGNPGLARSVSVVEGAHGDMVDGGARAGTSTPTTPTPASAKKGWFSWS